MLLDEGSNIILAIERASNDLRKGFPVIIETTGTRLAIASPETTPEKIISILLAAGKTELVIAANRAKLLTGGKTKKTSSININESNFQKIAPLCGLSLCGLSEDELKIDKKELSKCNTPQEDALNLTKIAELLPAVITTELPQNFDDANLLSVPADYIGQYKALVSYNITEACRTRLTLRHSIESEIVAYRPNIGGKEHYAIIIGSEPDKNPLVRIHSSCYTGDLLDSLACDCHDQLHSAIELMNNEGGGIILYMLQEGRGIGLINKLRAYALKETGLDTVDANEALGFDDDERLFVPAAEILKKMDITQVRLLTNNPKKATGLEECGIRVSECVPHIMKTNIHNEQYLKTKSDRLGHKI